MICEVCGVKIGWDEPSKVFFDTATGRLVGFHPMCLERHGYIVRDRKEVKSNG